MSNAKCLMVFFAASSLLEAVALPSSKYSKLDSQLSSSGEIIRFSSRYLWHCRNVWVQFFEVQIGKNKVNSCIQALILDIVSEGENVLYDFHFA